MGQRSSRSDLKQVEQTEQCRQGKMMTWRKFGKDTFDELFTFKIVLKSRDGCSILKFFRAEEHFWSVRSTPCNLLLQVLHLRNHRHQGSDAPRYSWWLWKTKNGPGVGMLKWSKFDFLDVPYSTSLAAHTRISSFSGLILTSAAIWTAFPITKMNVYLHLGKKTWRSVIPLHSISLCQRPMWALHGIATKILQLETTKQTSIRQKRLDGKIRLTWKLKRIRCKSNHWSISQSASRSGGWSVSQSVRQSISSQTVSLSVRQPVS